MDSTLNHEELGRADEQLARLEEQLSKLGGNAARRPSDPQTRMNMFRRTVLGVRSSSSGWALRVLTGFLSAACIGVGAIIWWSNSGDAAKTVAPQPASLAQTAPAAAAPSPELTQLLVSMARDIATVEQAIRQLKTSQEQMARDNANVAGQLKTAQEQMVGVIAKLSEQLKASQEQLARDNANVAEQLNANQEQLARLNAEVSERPRPISAPPLRPTSAPPRKPGPMLSSPQATAQPKAGKPQLSSASRRPMPVR